MKFHKPNWQPNIYDDPENDKIWLIVMICNNDYSKYTELINMPYEYILMFADYTIKQVKLQEQAYNK